jgi:hypothetical protein
MGDEEISTMNDLAEVFNEEVEAPIEAAPEPKEEAPAVEEAVETDTTGEKDDSTPEPKTEEESKSVPITALMDERRKRQELQKQVDGFNAKKPEPAPDIFDDQAAYTEHQTSQMNSALFNERANISEFHARREFKDLDKDIEAFQLLKSDNPSLMTQVQNSPSPYHEIHSIVERHEKMERMQNVEEFEKTTRAELEIKIRSEIEAEMKGKAEIKEKLRDSIPTSLVNEPSKGTVSGQSWGGPSPLEDILGD